MKYFQIILIISLLGGCSYKREEFNYLGAVPSYAVDGRDPALRKSIAPKELHKNFIEVKKSKESS